MRAQLALICLALPALALGACSKVAGKAHLPPTLSQALAHEGALNAGGEDPFWALQVRPKFVAFSAEDVPELRIDNSGPDSAKDGARWQGAATDGRKLAVAIHAQPCHDEATGLSYPFTAEVQAAGRSFKGCATQAGQGLGPHD